MQPYVHLVMSPMSRKLLITFSNDSSLTLDKIITSIDYTIGYIGVFGTDHGINVYLQGQRMVPSSLAKKMSKLGRILSDPVPFSTVSGRLLFESGVLKNRGRKHGTKVVGGRVIPNTEFHIHALGKEDISHITPKKISNIIGTEESVIGSVSGFFNEQSRANIIRDKWREFRKYSRHRVRVWDKINGDNVLSESLGVCSKSDESGSEYESDMEITSTPVYDEDSDSEGNRKRKRNLLEEFLLDANSNVSKGDFIREFEELVYDNPHNSNVVASTDKGHFKYFNGSIWITVPRHNFFDTVITRRISSVIGQLHGIVSPFVKGQVSSMMDGLRDLAHSDPIYKDIVRNSIMLSENQNRKLKSSWDLYNPKKRMKKVGSGYPGFTWDNFG